MARYYNFGGYGVYAKYPVIGKLTGLKLAKRSGIESVCDAQSGVFGLGRRIVLSQSLSGLNQYSIGNSNPTTAFSAIGSVPARIYPLSSASRVVRRARFSVTPGCFLAMDVLYTPSGETQTAPQGITIPDGTSYRRSSDGRGGYVRLVVAWRDADGSIVNTTHNLFLDTSVRTYGGYSTNSDAWVDVRVATLPFIAPSDTVERVGRRRWSRHTLANITMSHRGGVRIVDAVIYERPYTMTLEADDPRTYWTSHLFPAGSSPKLGHPVEEVRYAADDGDPRGGPKMMADVHEAQWNRLGPALINWGAWNEGNAHMGDSDGTTITEPAFTTTSSTFVRVHDGSTTGYSTANLGWSLAAGSYSRRAAENPTQVMANNGSIPVWVDVYANATASSTNAVVRIQSSPYSWVDVTLTGLTTSPGWTSAYGHLRCGRGPGDPSIVQGFVRRSSGTGTVQLYSLSVTRAGNWSRP